TSGPVGRTFTQYFLCTRPFRPADFVFRDIAIFKILDGPYAVAPETVETIQVFTHTDNTVWSPYPAVQEDIFVVGAECQDLVLIVVHVQGCVPGEVGRLHGCRVHHHIQALVADRTNVHHHRGETG